MLNGTRVFSYTQDNTRRKPNEDRLGISQEGFYAVADGATRSRLENGEYPELSALLASEAFCTYALLDLKRYHSIFGAFKYGNEAVSKVNRKHGITLETIDYLQNDFLGCVAALGMLTGEFPYELTYGYIGDCGILVYDKNLLPVLLSENQLGILEQFRDQWGFSEDTDLKKRLWRKEMRNQSLQSYMTYGLLTGEESALTYVRTGSLQLEAGDTVLFFSDGILPFIYNRWFRRILREDFREKNKEQFMEIFKNNLGRLALERAAKGVENLDDDKTFIAISILDTQDV